VGPYCALTRAARRDCSSFILTETLVILPPYFVEKANIHTPIMQKTIPTTPFRLSSDLKRKYEKTAIKTTFVLKTACVYPGLGAIPTLFTNSKLPKYEKTPQTANTAAIFQFIRRLIFRTYICTRAQKAEVVKDMNKMYAGSIPLVVAYFMPITSIDVNTVAISAKTNHIQASRHDSRIYML
jgi:hypothetical protein